MDMVVDFLRSIPQRLRNVTWSAVIPPVLLVGGGFLLALWLTFPLADLIENKTRRMWQDDQVRVEFDEANVDLFGPTIKGLRIDSPLPLEIDEIRIRPRLSTLWFLPGIAVNIEAGGGRIRADRGGLWTNDMNLEIDAVDILQLGLGAALPMGTTLTGKLSGTGTANLLRDSLDGVTGSVNLEMTEAEIRLADGMPLPVSTIPLQFARAQLEINAGTLTITPLQLDGGDLIYGTVRGTIQLRHPYVRSQAEIRIRLKLGEQLQGALGPFLPVAGFRNDGEWYVREFHGQVSKMLGGG